MQGDPLAQLRDIHLPEPVAAWPPGPGWWVLAGLALLSIAALIILLVRRHRANAWRRQALAELGRAHDAWQQGGDASRYLQQLSEILKRAALCQQADDGVAGLCGAEWDQYLDRRWRRPPPRGFSSLGFGERVHHPAPAAIDIESLHELGQQWIRELRRSAC